MEIKYCKLFLEEEITDFKWDMIQFTWVKTFKQKKGFILSALKAQH